ncbi:hypothetical protein BJ170DRAFT_713926 [Xylariales sp. AK1849]|nr:hypothetical protein BJ170DRAFT_713926 [Xylariales sp. AK1849]
MSPSRAIYLEASGDLSVREITETYVPEREQALVAVRYSAVNPADLGLYYMGIHSNVVGYEWIGPVVSVGPDSPYKPGEVLFGMVAWGHLRALHTGAHQDFRLAEPYMTYRVPPTLAAQEDQWPQIASWPVGARTGIDVLFNSLGFAFPPLNNEIKGVDPGGRAILIWGGSSTVGLATIQLARLAGFSPIYTTASPRNHAALHALGATACFDYRSPTVVAEVRAAVSASGKPLSVIFDAVATGMGVAEPPSTETLDLGKSSPAIAKQCLSDGVDKEDMRLCASLPVAFDPDWNFCMAARDEEEFPDFHWRLGAVTGWLLENHEGVFKIPNVRIVKGAEEGIKAIKQVFEGKVSMEKVVLQHPM